MCPLLTNEASKFLGGGRLAAPVPVLGAEMVTDSGLEANYTAGKCDTLSVVGSPTLAQSADVHGGSKAQQFTATALSNRMYQTAAIATVAGSWYLGSTWFKRTAGSGGTVRFGSATGPAISSATYTQLFFVERPGPTSSILDIRETGASNFDTVVFDDRSYKTITLASMFSVRPYVTHATTKAMCTIVAGTRAGVVANLDSAATPANFVIASHDGTTARLTKCVAGTYTELLAVTTTYAAGAYVEIRRILGTNDYELWYNGAQVGAAQTITDVGIISNTLAGMFNTYAGNTLAAFSCIPSTVPSYSWATAGGAPTPVAAYLAKGAASLAASYVNLANPGTNHAAPGVAPTFAVATGWAFNGSKELKTGINSATGMSVLVRFSDAVGDWRCALGGENAGNGIVLNVRYTGETVHTYNNGATRISVAPALTSGVIAIAGTKGYLNGTEETSALNNSISVPTELYIGADFNGVSTGSSYSGNIQAIAIYNSVLTPAQVAAVSAAMAAL